jgi:hypothetical protein
MHKLLSLRRLEIGRIPTLVQQKSAERIVKENSLEGSQYQNWVCVQGKIELLAKRNKGKNLD